MDCLNVALHYNSSMTESSDFVQQILARNILYKYLYVHMCLSRVLFVHMLFNSFAVSFMIPSIHFCTLSGFFKTFFTLKKRHWYNADELYLKHMCYSQMMFDVNKFILIGEVQLMQPC